MKRIYMLSVGLLMSFTCLQTSFGMEDKLDKYFNLGKAINTKAIAKDLADQFGVDPQAIEQPLKVTLQLNTEKIKNDRLKSGAFGGLSAVGLVLLANILFPEAMNSIHSSRLLCFLAEFVIGYAMYQVYGALEFYHTPKEALARAVYDVVKDKTDPKDKDHYEDKKKAKKKRAVKDKTVKREKKKKESQKDKAKREKERNKESDEEISNKEELLDSISAEFKKFKAGLNKNQKDKIVKVTRLKRNPIKLLKEPLLLQQLNSRQDQHLANILETVASDKANPGFAAFERKLSGELTELLSNITKLEIAQYAPGVLSYETEFYEALQKNRRLAQDFEALCEA